MSDTRISSCIRVDVDIESAVTFVDVVIDELLVTIEDVEADVSIADVGFEQRLVFSVDVGPLGLLFPIVDVVVGIFFLLGSDSGSGSDLGFAVYLLYFNGVACEAYRGCRRTPRRGVVPQGGFPPVTPLTRDRFN